MDGATGTQSFEEKYRKGFRGINLQERDNLQNPEIGGRMI